MVDRLSNDFSFHIVTLNRDGCDREPYSNIDRDLWVPVNKAMVMYLDPATVSMQRLVSIVTDCTPDVIYLNSFFDPTFTQRILVARRLGLLGKIPIVLAPRGEFSEGALQLKQVKKRIYIRLSRLTGLYRDLIWQASSLFEQADILRQLKFVPEDDIRIATDLTPHGNLSDFKWVPRQPGEPLRVCFLSRISPKKNLDFALRVLSMVQTPILFTIYGPKEVPAYWMKCKQLIANLPANVRAFYAGPIHPDEVTRTLSLHDLFFFPTRGENYGHVIHEALNSGLPVLLSDQTPWDDVVERSVGWTYSLYDVENFARTIDEISEWDSERLAQMRTRATSFAKEKATNNEVLHANRQIFYSAISGRRS
jgi:glycosyltransferase involved in cell wall biosynthesis